MPSQENAALFHALLASIAVHAVVLCLNLEPKEQGNDLVSALPATLFVVERTETRAALPSSARGVGWGGGNDPLAINKASLQAVGGNAGTEGAEHAWHGIDSPAGYVASAQLDKRAYPLTVLNFPYPDVFGAQQEGTIVLTLYVGKDGSVDRIDIDSASIDQKVVDLAIEALRATPFSPGERNGQAVGARMRLEVNYAFVEY